MRGSVTNDCRLLTRRGAVAYDVHAHCIPPGVAPHLGSYLGSELRDPPRPDLIDLPARLAAMDRAGVHVQLVSGWIGLTGYDLPADQGVRWARRFNDALTEMTAKRPERFLGLCHVPLQAPEEAADELRRCVEELGMVGVEIATTVDGAELDDERLEPFWAAAAELRCLVLIHPDQRLPGRRQPRYFLNNTVGNAAEITIAVAHLVCSGVLERYPGLRLCVVHGGGYLPYQAGRLDRGYTAQPAQTAGPARAGGRLPRPPSAYLRSIYFDTITHSPRALRFLIDFAGADHVVLGSDYPFEMGDPDPVRTLGAVPVLTAEERRLILRDNVRRLLSGVRRPAALR
ncbi:MAG: amidohydrolase family protein [Streptosporangiales bacterium]|nr:amidohydrolase family protein [Streptosporangiales bacterium]